MMSGNENHYCMCITPDSLNPNDLERLKGHRAAYLNEAKWNPGDTITIRFLEGDEELRERVKAVALEWTDIANLNLEFTDSAPSDIRIAFEAGNGSWSYLGTVCRKISEPEPTMNYGWLTPDSPDEELRRVVLHEFGHALGLIHEHQNPEGGIKWNRAAVIKDLKGPPNNWDRATIENNIFKKYEDVDATSVDANSIMMYPIPKAWTLDGFSAGFNSELSETDIEKTREVYPK